jgi:hypothetical protein
VKKTRSEAIKAVQKRLMAMQNNELLSKMESHKDHHSTQALEELMAHGVLEIPTPTTPKVTDDLRLSLSDTLIGSFLYVSPQSQETPPQPTRLQMKPFLRWNSFECFNTEGVDTADDRQALRDPSPSNKHLLAA